MQYDPIRVEKEVLQYWQEQEIYKKVKDKGKGKTKFYFLDGPPYTSGKVHIGTAWNKSMKDMVIRFKRMAGFDVWDRAGYDMHGLPTEHKVQKKFGVHLKEEIKQFGVARFVKECEKFCIENMEAMNTDFKRMGVWMDFDNPYMSITKDFIDGVWWMIKKVHDNKRLYEGRRTMTWCGNCETSVAKHELEYVNVIDESIYVKLKAKEPSVYYIIWTTTPWTIPYNLCIMAHPGITYAKVKVGDEIWIVAKELTPKVAPEGTIVEEFLGAELEGKEYQHPFSDKIDYARIKKESPNVHTIVMSAEYVNLEQGTGLVHCAPGCGPEDYEVGHRNGIKPFNTLDERGRFQKFFTGLTARKDDKAFIQELEHAKALVKTEQYQHEYPHCWRCHQAVVFRTTKQWFFMVEDLKEKILTGQEKVKWVPEAGKNAMRSWLENLRDNSISKQNFWGTPLPVWRCDTCNKYDVFGSIKEVEDITKTKIDNPHKPWIDKVTYACNCGGTKKRLPDILDVWLDAGSASWNCLDFPKREDLMKQWFPATEIIEGKDQIRGWFNLLIVAGYLTLGKLSFENVYMHGFVQDAKGRKMSKSLGNYILPGEVFDKYGVDTFRYYAIGSSAPGLDMMYNDQDIKQKYRNLRVLWNLHNYVLELGKDVTLPTTNVLAKEEKYIQSKLHSTILAVTKELEQYNLPSVPNHLETFFLELSRDYGQWARAKIKTPQGKQTVLHTLFTGLLQTIKMFGIVAPFVCEKMYQNLKKEFDLKEESLFMHDWPQAKSELIDKSLETEIGMAKEIITAALAVRDRIGQGLKWPLQELVITGSKEIIAKAKLSEELIKQSVNVKRVEYKEELPGLKLSVKPNFGNINKDFEHGSKIIKELQSMLKDEETLQSIAKERKVTVGKNILNHTHLLFERIVPKPFEGASWTQGMVYLNTETTPELEAEGYAREVIRRFQVLRKQAGMHKSLHVDAHIQADKNMITLLQPHLKKIQQSIHANALTLTTKPVQYAHKAGQKIREKDITLFVQ